MTISLLSLREFEFTIFNLRMNNEVCFDLLRIWLQIELRSQEYNLKNVKSVKFNKLKSQSEQS